MRVHLLRRLTASRRFAAAVPVAILGLCLLLVASGIFLISGRGHQSTLLGPDFAAMLSASDFTADGLSVAIPQGWSVVSAPDPMIPYALAQGSTMTGLIPNTYGGILVVRAVLLTQHVKPGVAPLGGPIVPTLASAPRTDVQTVRGAAHEQFAYQDGMWVAVWDWADGARLTTITQTSIMPVTMATMRTHLDSYFAPLVNTLHEAPGR